MTNNTYDIFISYRRDGGAQYARILQLEMEKRGYRVFLDYEELTDGVFGDNIKEAIRKAPIFMMVLSAHYLDRCKNEGDWVREEIILAIKEKKRFVPINPDNSFDGIPAEIPEEIKKIVWTHQHSEINFGQLLGPSIDRMVKNRVDKYVKRRNSSKLKWTGVVITTICLIVVIAGVGLYFMSDSGKAVDGTAYQKVYDDQLVKAANEGDAKAQYYLGLVYENGYGTVSNVSAAVEWYRRAAEQGLDSAQINLGICYLKGTGITKDEREGEHWLTMAAEKGNTDAMFNLGAYLFNKGDLAIGTRWLKNAAERGHVKATETLKKIGEWKE